METLSFAFGVLTVVGIALAAAVVVGIVKVFKMQKQIKDLKDWIVYKQSEQKQHLDYEIQNLYRVDADDQRELNDRVDGLNSYIDSRLDKLESKFIGNSAKKQIING